MGYGFGMRCPKCGFSYNMFLDGGMRDCREEDLLTGRVKKDRRFQEWRPIFKAIPDAECVRNMVVYQCPKCLAIDNVRETVLIGKQNGRYKILARSQHYCKACGSKMKVTENLKCPHCRTDMEKVSTINWD